MSDEYKYNLGHAEDDLAEDEKEIKYYEKKLGINQYKKKGKSIPFIKHFGLEDLFSDIDRLSEEFKKTKKTSQDDDDDVEEDNQSESQDEDEEEEVKEQEMSIASTEPKKKNLSEEAVLKRKLKNRVKRLNKRKKRRLDAVEKSQSDSRPEDVKTEEDSKEEGEKNYEDIAKEEEGDENSNEAMEMDDVKESEEEDENSDNHSESDDESDSPHKEENNATKETNPTDSQGSQGRQLHSCRRSLRRLFLLLEEAHLEKFIQDSVTILRRFPQAVATKAFQMECLHLLQVKKGTPRLEAHLAAFTVSVHVRLRNCQAVGNLGAILLEALINQLGFSDPSSKMLEGLRSHGNVMMYIAFLYKFGLLNDNLMLDILQLVSPAYKNVDVCRLLTQVISEIGVQLRRNNFQGFDRFMRENFATLQASNKVEKSLAVALRKAKQGVYNPKDDPYFPLSRQFTRWIDGMSKERYRLSLTLNDLLSSEEKGRWWLTGAPTTKPIKQKKG